MRWAIVRWSVLFVAVWAGSPGGARAARPSDTLLPATTKAYVSVANVDMLRASWDRTQLGQLMQDPAMKAFVDDLRAQMKSKLSASIGDLGISLDELEGVANGELAGAFIQSPDGAPATVLLIDVTERQAKVDDLLAKARRRLLDEGAKESKKAVNDTTVVIFDVSKIVRKPVADDASGAPQVSLPGEELEVLEPYVKTVAYFQKDHWLCLATRVDALENILGRFGGDHHDSLHQQANYLAVMDRCARAAGSLVPQARWFADPVGFFEAARQIHPDRTPEGTDVLKVIKNQGFTAVRAVGGFVNLAEGSYDLLHRTAVFAPGPYVKAMRMASLPNVTDLAPPAWVPGNVAAYVALNWDMKNAFEMASTLFDELFGEGEEGVFDDTLDSIRDDPNGPGIDVRQDLIAHIGTRAIVLLDYQLPASTTSERTLFAAETTNESALALSIAKAMQGDPTVTKREFEGHVIWEIKEEELPDAPRIELADDALPLEDDVRNPLPGEEPGEEEPGRLLPSSAITVAHGYIFVASHVDFLETILAQNPVGLRLAQCEDYRAVTAELDKLGGPEKALHMFRRTADEYETPYALLKEGRMPESQALLGKVLNKLFQTPEGEVREAAIDGSSLPDYETVRPHLTPSGATLVSEENGWFLTGFTLAIPATTVAAP